MHTRAPKPVAAIRPGPSQPARTLLLLSLITLAPFARLYARNLQDDIVAAEIRHYALLAVAVACGIYLLLHVLIRPKNLRLSAASATFAFLFFQFGEVTDPLADHGADPALQSAAFLAVLLVALGTAAALGNRAGFHRFLLTFAVLLLAVPAYSIASTLIRRGAPAGPSDPEYALADNPIWSGTAVRKPDIYWIVADSYPGRSVLQDDFSFDNRDFYAALSSRGFYVAHSSHASYSTTVLSVSSTFEMRTLYEAGEDANVVMSSDGRSGPSRAKRSRLDALAGDNRSVAFLKQLGYRYVHFEGLTYQATRCRGFEDVCLSDTTPRFSELETTLLAMTPLRRLGLFDDDAKPQPKNAKKRQQSESGTGIPELAAGISSLPRERPLFLYAHIFSPHGPHHNDARCNRIPKRRIRNPIDFTDQLQCVNLHLTKLIDQIIRDSPDSVIVINSDHGPRLSAFGFQSIFDYSPAQIREHLSILNAIRVPAACRSHLRPDLSPINTLRLVFACLGGHEPRFIEDRHFIAAARPKHRDYGKLREVELR